MREGKQRDGEAWNGVVVVWAGMLVGSGTGWLWVLRPDGCWDRKGAEARIERRDGGERNGCRVDKRNGVTMACRAGRGAA